MPGSVAVPKGRWSGPGIVHLGIGAFHRAHQAVMLQVAMDAGETGWGIIAASLRSPDTRDALRPQDGLYTVAVKSPEGERLQVIGAVGDVLVAREDPGALIACMSDPRIRIVSMTVSEKGYCHNPATGALNEAHPDIIHDLANPDRPRSAPGFLVAALARRRAAGVAPFTVLCCDNLPSNGRTVRRVVVRYAELVDPALGRFVAGEVAFPSTMVDRIVPATTDADRDRIAAALGVRDAWPVVTEPFTQWVIEENFPTGRPRWELGGAQFVRDVEPFELMKLRMLNGAHSTLAYLGAVAGHETVADASNDPAFAAMLRGLWQEIIPSLAEPEGQQPSAYAEALLARFQNTAIRHRLLQIAMDGSQKLPQRLLGTVADNLATGRPIRFLALGVAAWMRFVMGASEAGGRHEINDPLAGRITAVTTAAGRDARALAEGLLAIEAIFAPALVANSEFRAAVTGQLASLIENGVVPTIAAQSKLL
ncbi:MAG TPA: mannitol dehydrogenase family protein [Beijerinckiaceae bacterium]|nr:mannitol dehydrogenase family protein [Beijerinckiaceae bacterium]